MRLHKSVKHYTSEFLDRPCVPPYRLGRKAKIISFMIELL